TTLLVRARSPAYGPESTGAVLPGLPLERVIAIEVPANRRFTPCNRGNSGAALCRLIERVRASLVVGSATTALSQSRGAAVCASPSVAPAGGRGMRRRRRGFLRPRLGRRAGRRTGRRATGRCRLRRVGC